MKITIDKNAVEKSGKKIIECNSYFIDDIAKLNGVIDGINNAWDGADALKYVNDMRDKYIYKLKELSSILENYGEYLKNVPGAYEILDETFSNKNINIGE